MLADLCKEVKCAHGARCENGVCVCPTDCPALPEEPICASNMQTYASECEMQRQACLADPPLSLTVVFYGDCNDRLGPVMTSKHLLHCISLPLEHEKNKTTVILEHLRIILQYCYRQAFTLCLILDFSFYCISFRTIEVINNLQRYHNNVVKPITYHL